MGQSISKIGGNTLADIKFREQVKKLDSKVDLFDSQLNDIANNKTDKSTTQSIQQQVNNLVLGAVGDGNNAEVIQARGKFNTLNDRLCATDKYIDVFHKNINKEISFTVENGGITSGNNIDHDHINKQIRARSIEMNYA